ncbi:protein of unknown function [Ruminococcaceae bacterium BL-6]|nr:protein of unknown function [Ruminococcaceae bacterium BL-6]
MADARQLILFRLETVMILMTGSLFLNNTLHT